MSNADVGCLDLRYKKQNSISNLCFGNGQLHSLTVDADGHENKKLIEAKVKVKVKLELKVKLQFLSKYCNRKSREDLFASRAAEGGGQKGNLPQGLGV